MPYFENNGARIYYEKKGAWESGRYPVLLLHGNGESMEIFDKTIEPISDRFPFLAIDTRGHGKSELLNENYDFSDRMFADDVRRLFEENGLEKTKTLTDCFGNKRFVVGTCNK